MVRRDFCLSSNLPFEFELTSQLVMARVHLLTLREPCIFTFKVEICFMREGMKLWTPLFSLSRLNTELLTCAGDELNDFLPPMILVKTGV